MGYDRDLADRIRRAVPARTAEKPMFGGLSFLVGGNMAIGVIDDRMVVRVGPDTYEDALAEPNVREMDFTGRAMRGWVYVEPKAIASDDDLASWVARGISFARSLPAKRPAG